MFKPRDAHRFAQRLWAEQSSGLLLRADVLGARGEVLGVGVVLRRADRRQAESRTWCCRGCASSMAFASCALPRPHQARCRGLEHCAPGAGLSAGWLHAQRSSARWRRPTSANAQVLMAVFSDGLTHVSVFVEPYDAQRHKPVATSLGATHTVMIALRRLVDHRDGRRADGHGAAVFFGAGAAALTCSVLEFPLDFSFAALIGLPWSDMRSCMHRHTGSSGSRSGAVVRPRRRWRACLGVRVGCHRAPRARPGTRAARLHRAGREVESVGGQHPHARARPRRCRRRSRPQRRGVLSPLRHSDARPARSAPRPARWRRGAAATAAWARASSSATTAS